MSGSVEIPQDIIDSIVAEVGDDGVCSNNAPSSPPHSFSLVASNYSPESPSEATKLAREFINFSSKIQSFSPLSEILLS